MVNGAKMGQTVRQTMPFNAHYAFVQAGKNAGYGQQTRASPAKTATYPSTIGVWEDRSERALFIGNSEKLVERCRAKEGHWPGFSAMGARLTWAVRPTQA